MVPPGLSLCLSIGIEYAQSRLNKKAVVALKGRLINAAGRMKAVYFDKTGTLTINEMKVQSVIFSDQITTHGAKPNLVDLDHGVAGDEIHSLISRSNPTAYRELMLHFVTNHSLAFIKGEVLGDPMEDELFKYAEGVLLEPEADDLQKTDNLSYLKKVRYLGDTTTASNDSTLFVLGVLDFKSELQRMSVIAKDVEQNRMLVFTKGAPEKVLKLCTRESLPNNLNSVISRLSKNGYRILAFGCKDITDSFTLTGTRDSYESSLTFQGLAIFKNNLKQQTRPTIENLKKADVKVGMITGDNINTAVSIARNSRIINPKLEEIGTYTFTHQQLVFTPIQDIDQADDFDLTGSRLEEQLESLKKKRKKVAAIDSENFSKIVLQFNLEETAEVDASNPVLKELAETCIVFARMTPEQKALIVRIMKAYFKVQEVTVGFCGDGANDCIALKEADIGISLSKTEASLSAPFISSVEDISCVESVLAEGKAALTTNYDCFRYFCLYSIISTIGLEYLFAIKLEYSDAIYITTDIVIALNVANCMGLLSPRSSLVKQLPHATLFSRELLASIFMNCVLAVGYFAVGAFVVRLDPNYKSPEEIVHPAEGAPDGHSITFEGTVAAADGRWRTCTWCRRPSSSRCPSTSAASSSSASTSCTT